jgi:hypothetical protein
MISYVLDAPAIFSENRLYRYTLTRMWNPNKEYACFVGLNPSTADEVNNDPTVRRCINYAKDWGYGGFVMLNIFAWRSTDPKPLYNLDDPVGNLNDYYLQLVSKYAGLTVAAWGTHGKLKDRGNDVLNLLTNPYCLKITKHGFPSHPLYLKKNLKPILFSSAKGIPGSGS